MKRADFLEGYETVMQPRRNVLLVVLRNAACNTAQNLSHNKQRNTARLEKVIWFSTKAKILKSISQQMIHSWRKSYCFAMLELAKQVGI